MPHKKGVTNNPNGRPTGKPNKATKELRELMQSFIEANIQDLQKEYDNLEGLDKFMQYVLPKYSAVEFLEAVKRDDQPMVIVLTKSQHENLSNQE